MVDLIKVWQWWKKKKKPKEVKEDDRLE